MSTAIACPTEALSRSLLALLFVLGCNRTHSKYVVLSGDFTPSREELDRFEAALPRALPPSLAMKGPDYHRQYSGYVEGGTRFIHGNFFCSWFVEERDNILERNRWRWSTVEVDDGGDCFFRIDFSPDTGATRNLYIHGQ